MTTEEIKQGNELIAKFMGYQIDDTKQFFPYTHFYKMTTDKYTYDQLDINSVRSYTEGFVFGYEYSIEKRYDNSWDWIMPVVEKIESLNDFNNSVVIGKYWVVITVPVNKSPNKYFENKRYNDKLYNTWKACIEFIKWYNENE